MNEEIHEVNHTSIAEVYDTFKYFIKRSEGWPFVVFFFLVTIIICFLTIYRQIWSNKWVGSADYHANYYIFILLSLSFLRSLGSLVMLKRIYNTSMLQSLHDDMAKSILFAPLTTLQQTPLSKLMNLFSLDLGVCDKNLTSEFSFVQLYL